VVRTSPIIVALGILLLGLCAALPFRQPPRPPAPPRERPLPLSLTIRRPDSPLELAPRIDVSPAVGLEARGLEAREQGTGDRGQEAIPVAPPDLANLVPPPALPVSFQPSASGPQPNDWRPDVLANAPRPRVPPRPYRLRDGDTLEKIAERLLGDPYRAIEIFAMNPGVLERPDLLPVGATIMLPPKHAGDNLTPAAQRSFSPEP
jgi:nucleoid-associated protein YgaU